MTLLTKSHDPLSTLKPQGPGALEEGPTISAEALMLRLRGFRRISSWLQVSESQDFATRCPP